MQRGSSVNFQPIKLASHAVSHAARDVQPEYLLPPDKSLGTIIFIDDHGKVASTLEAKLALASRQAKRQGDYSPLWEGVINLRSPKPGEDEKKYKNACSTVIAIWCDEYTKLTGHKVLRADIHLDEGRLDQETGEILFNAHAHVMCDKTNDLGRVLKVNAPTLRKIQDFTSEITGLKRGENSLKTGRKHIGHQQYKALAEKGRLETQQKVGEVKVQLDKSQSDLERQRKLSKEWSDADLAKVKNLQAKLDGEPARLDAALKAQEAQLNEQYRADREALKASGEAKQADYQALKKSHAEQLEALKTKLAKTETEAAKVPKLEAQAVQAQAQIAQLTPLAAQVPGLKEQVQKMDAYSQNLKAALVESNQKIAAALEAKAQAIEDLVKAGEKSEELLKTVKSYREDAAKIVKIAADFRAENVALKAEIVEVKAKFETLAKTHQEEAAKPVPTIQQPREAVPSLGPNARAGLRAKQMALEATRMAQEPPKQLEAPTPSPAPVKSLVERLGESMKAMLEWIKSIGGEQAGVTANSKHGGPVKHLDDLHCIQKTGRTSYAIHQLAHLDQVPALDDPDMVIRYKDGKGTVEGKSGPGVQR